MDTENDLHVIYFQKDNSTYSTIDEHLYFDSDIQFYRNSKKYLKISKIYLSADIPNVIEDLNNQIKISKDGGSTWTTINLSSGVYSVDAVNEAVNYNIKSSWYTDETDYGIKISPNTVTNSVYITIDSTKFADIGAQGAVDLSTIKNLLGFSSTTVYTTDGVFICNSNPNFDWFGNYIDIHIKGLGVKTIKNGSISDKVASINLSTDTINNLYVYPNGTIPPKIPLPSLNKSINHLQFFFRGTRENKNIVLRGQVYVEFVIIDK